MHLGYGLRSFAVAGPIIWNNLPDIGRLRATELLSLLLTILGAS